jgi:hypothetical protein
MAYAPYHNGNRGGKARILGGFTEKEAGHRFEYYERNSIDRHSFAFEYPHRIFVGPDTYDTRCALVKKTVAYVVVDEDHRGYPVVEKWKIRAHREYPV